MATINSPIKSYKTIVFDCDGVVLDSNWLKSRAFYQAVIDYGYSATEEFMLYHRTNGGVSRYKKFQHFVDNILPSNYSVTVEDLLKKYSSFLDDRLMKCAVGHGLSKFREVTSEAKWMIVSGGDQEELRSLFRRRSLDLLFDGGIFGSPDTKEVILRRSIEAGNIRFPALFIGDSKYDYESASTCGLDFLFLSSLSESRDWATWTQDLGVSYSYNLESVLERLG